MNNKYSPSKLNAFDGCKLKYRYQYVDGLESDLETIEGFMGSRVHESLEALYGLVKSGKIESLDWLLTQYDNFWNKNFNENIKVIKKDLTTQDYYNKGKTCLTDYYNTYKPFNQSKTVDLECHIDITTKIDGSDRLIHGYIDRLAWDDKNKVFEVHDYKTTNKLMTQEEADEDIQLGFYSLAVQEKWPDTEKIKLIWHALTFNKEIISYRTKEQTDSLKNSLSEKIKEVESCVDFLPNKTSLCDWCGFQNICPLWKHPKEMEQLPINEYKKDPGVKLVADYKKLEDEKDEENEKIRVIEEEQLKIEEAAISFAKNNQISIIDGPNAQLKIDIKNEIRPLTKAENAEQWKQLRDILIKEGKFQDVSTINANMLSYQMKTWPVDIMEKITKFLIHKTTETVRLIKKR